MASYVKFGLSWDGLAKVVDGTRTLEDAEERKVTVEEMTVFEVLESPLAPRQTRSISASDGEAPSSKLLVQSDVLFQHSRSECRIYQWQDKQMFASSYKTATISSKVDTLGRIFFTVFTWVKSLCQSWH